MDNLPTEILVNILRFLPREDLLRLRRLCRRIPAILDAHKKQLPRQRPQVTLALKTVTRETPSTFIGNEERTRVRSNFHQCLEIKTRWETFRVFFMDSIDYEKTPRAESFFLKWEEIAKTTRFALQQYKLFFQWLLSRVDVDVFSLHDEMFQTVQNAFIPSASSSDCRIDKVWISSKSFLDWMEEVPKCVYALAKASRKMEIEGKDWPTRFPNKLRLLEQLRQFYDSMGIIFEREDVHNALYLLAHNFSRGDIEQVSPHFTFRGIRDLTSMSTIMGQSEVRSRIKGMGIQMNEGLDSIPWTQLINFSSKDRDELYMRREDGKVLRIQIEDRDLLTQMTFQIQ